MAEKWLEREVIAGLQGLVALRLDGAPAADAITHTLDIWLVAMSKGREWDAEQDAPRIRSAFSTLFATCERWPAPARLMRELPGRKRPPALSRPAQTEEQRHNGRQKIAEILAGLKRVQPTTEQHPK